MMHGYARWSGLAFQMVAVVLAGFFSGRLCDRWVVNSDSWFTLAGLLIGVIAAMILAIRMIVKP